MHKIRVKPFTQDLTANFYLHAVVFIVHILDPGNELTSVEAISHRFVLITLTTCINGVSTRSLLLIILVRNDSIEA